MARKRVYVAYTGGSVGMRRTADGYAPDPEFLETELRRLPELQSPEVPEHDLRTYDPLLDSADMAPSDWLRIARDIQERYDDHDGFVVLHGTDTMAYTASALSFMLGGLDKPVILTGSQIPLAELRSDARQNLVTALLLAGREPLPEVCLLFGRRLLRGCRATKVNAEGFDAFDSPNFPPLASVGVEVRIRWDLVRRPERRRDGLEVQALEGPKVGALRLFPGISADVLANVLRPPLQGLVLEAFGVGNGPTRDPAFLRALAEATAPPRSVVVVATTQCRKGAVQLDRYAAGAALARSGAVSGGDMTAEAALAKLHYLIARGLPPAEIRAAVAQDLRGELTPAGS